MIEEKYDQVRRLINMGKERGYLLYDEVNDMLPAEVQPSEEIDDPPAGNAKKLREGHCETPGRQL